MIIITKEDFSKWTPLGRGKFGTVYQVDEDYAYKIYHSYIRDVNGDYVKNPCLRLSKIKLSLLKKRANYLKYTDLLDDVLFLDGEYYGVRIPFYHGKTLDNYLDEDFQTKYLLSHQLIRNSRELTKHSIYPNDYKLNNVMVENENIKIIDLDDICTHVDLFSNSIDYMLSTFALNETILSFFKEKSFPYKNSQFVNSIERKIWEPKTNYGNIEAFLAYKCRVKDYLFIDENTDLDLLGEIIYREDFRVLFEYPENKKSYSYFFQMLFELKKHNIPIFDFVSKEHPEDYFQNFPVRDTYTFENKILVKKNKF